MAFDKVEWERIYRNTPLGKYKLQRQQAKQRGIEWKFTFEDWCEVWQDSGKWSERGVTGYQMCRKGDEGLYSIDNVYIAHHLQNKQEQQINGKGSKPPVHNKLTDAERSEIYNTNRSTKHKELADKYGVDQSHNK